MSELKQNTRGMTKLLIHVHVDARERLASASRLTGSSQQSIIRNGIELILQRLEDRAEQPESTPKRRRSRKQGGAA
jgi:hypothetical protein